MNWTRLRSAVAMTGIIFLLVFFHYMPVSSNENPIDKTKGIQASLLQNKQVPGTGIKESHAVYFLQSKGIADVLRTLPK